MSSINIIKIALPAFAFIFLVSCAVRGNSTRNTPLIIKNPNKQTDKNNRAPGEYIVTARECSDISVIKRYFSSYGVIKIKLIHKYKGKHKYLIKLRNDPGAEEMAIKAEKSEIIIHIQPNYIYRIQP